MKPSLPFTQLDEFILEEIIQDSPHFLAVRGYQPKLKRPVFIKLLKPHTRENPLWAERFTREAQICARLKHPHIVDVYTLGEQDGYTFMVMEYVEGISLKQLLEKVGRLSVFQAVEIVHQICQALGVAHHHSIIHRDVKPGNILLDIHGLARLTDFGLAYLGEEASLTQQGSILGTPAYMAPEQITGEPLTPATDIFSLGATFYEMLTGIQPFAGQNYSECLHKILNEQPAPPSSVNSDVPPELDKLIEQMLAKDAAERPSEVESVMQHLAAWRKQYESEEVRQGLGKLVRQYYSAGEAPGVEKERDLPEKEKFPGSKTPGKSDASASPHKKRWWAIIFSVVIISIIGFILYANISSVKEKSLDSNSALAGSTTRQKNQILNVPPAASDEQPSPSASEYKLFESETARSENAPEPMVTSVLPEERPEQSVPPPPEEVKNAPTSLETNLPKPELYLKVEPWAILHVDGELKDSMVQELTLSLAPGNHQLVLAHPGFPPKTYSLTLEAGEKKTLQYSFFQEAGYLMVEVRPWAEIYIDGKYMENTPLREPLILSAGEHLLELRNPYFSPRRQYIQINPGDTVYIQEKLGQ